jgi:hypothetical protein
MLSDRQQKCAFICGIVVISLALLFPWLNFQDHLSQGDHGRDLYAGQAVLRGEMPYKDFWWVYGPAAPYVWGIFYKIVGAHVTTLILSKIFFKILAAVFLFLTLSTFTAPLMAALGALWFIIFHQDFFFTYNHIIGIAMVLGAAWPMALYLKNNHTSYAFYGLIPVFVLCLTKINFGIVALMMLALTVALSDWGNKTPFNSIKKSFYVSALLVLPCVIYLIYASMLSSLSLMEIRQCLPYLGDDQPYNTTPWLALKSFMTITFANMHSNWMNISLAVVLIASSLRCLALWIKGQLPTGTICFMAFLMVFYMFNFHEFLKSGVWYRGFWAQPLSIMLCFVVMDAATARLGFIRKVMIGFLLFMGFMSWQMIAGQVHEAKQPSQALSDDGKTVYVNNGNDWISTVSQTVSYLKTNLKSDELFFALPYDCLYYFLTGKKTPSRQLIFFDHIKIPPEQELSVIAELEKNHVDYVLISNRANARVEPGLGVFGKTYCPRIAAYVKENFETVAQFGDWTNEPGWAWNHGTMILKRKTHEN